MEKSNKKVLLGMSGGVDSSVSALLLQQQGYEVIGVTLNLLNNEEENKKINKDAKKICKILEIPHYTFYCCEVFRKYVINNFIEGYSKNLTPNPCIECNKHIKFGYMWEKAKELGCNYIATGHYAKSEFNEKYNEYILKKSNSENKDQSYVLWRIEKNILPYTIFPLAEFKNKDEIRKIAKENNLPVADKPDSEDICFIPDGNYKRFLESNSKLKPITGNIVTKDGKILGKHNGLYNYTIGQRKGLGISYNEPLYVIDLNNEKNEVIVGTKAELYKNEVHINNLNLLLENAIQNIMEIEVKIRYSAKSAKAILKLDNKEHSLATITFKEPQKAVTPGQSAVLYLGDIAIGGGIIIK